MVGLDVGVRLYIGIPGPGPTKSVAVAPPTNFGALGWGRNKLCRLLLPGIRGPPGSRISESANGGRRSIGGEIIIIVDADDNRGSGAAV